MRDFGIPPRCKLEIFTSVFVQTAKITEAGRCDLRHVLFRFVKEISINR
jgi:hypothetical protein